jgi:hypothetical protein
VGHAGVLQESPLRFQLPLPLSIGDIELLLGRIQTQEAQKLSVTVVNKPPADKIFSCQICIYPILRLIMKYVQTDLKAFCIADMISLKCHCFSLLLNVESSFGRNFGSFTGRAIIFKREYVWGEILLKYLWI